MVDIESDDVALRDVDGVASSLQVGHKAGISASGEKLIAEGGDGEALSFFVEKGKSAKVGEVAGFLGFHVREEEVIDGGSVTTDDGSGFAVGVGFVRAISEP